MHPPALTEVRKALPASQLQPFARIVGAAWERGFNPFWPCAVVLVVVLGGFYLLPLRGELHEWTHYVLLGLCLPLLLLGRLSAPVPALRHTPLRWALAGLFFLATTAMSWRYGQSHTWLLAAGQVSLVVGSFETPDSPARTARLAVKIVLALAAFPLMALSWFAASRLFWWKPFELSATSSNHRFLALVVAFALVATVAVAPSQRGGRVSGWHLGDLLALLVLGLASLRGDTLLPGGDPTGVGPHHWGMIVGPAELVRQGNWLLWDVPSPYGFLNTLLVAALPLGSVWQSLFVLNAFLLFLTATFLYALLRSLGSGPIQVAFALALSLAAVFLLPGWGGDLRGSIIAPAVGPYRFFWCFALLAVLVWGHRAGPRERVFWAGNITWLLGCLWSCESAIYGSVIWLPAYAVMAFSRTQSHEPWWKGNRLRSALPALVRPPFLLAGTGLLISAWYLLRLGHAPDWTAFSEYVVRFGGGRGKLPIDPRGAVWALVLVYAIGVTVVVNACRHARDLSLGLGAVGAHWITSSYFVGRSHEVIATNLSPVFCTVVALVLYLLRQRRDRFAQVVRGCCAPLLVVVVFAAFANPQALWDYVNRPPVVDVGVVDEMVPAMNGDLEGLFQTASVQPQDPVIFVLRDGILARPTGQGRSIHYRSWLPTAPFSLFVHLPPERARTYVERFVDRARLGGWLVQQTDGRFPNPYGSEWFFDALAATHSAAQVHEGAGWRLTRYAFKAPGSSAHPLAPGPTTQQNTRSPTPRQKPVTRLQL